MLALRDLTCSFDTTPVLRGINLTVERGEIFCLLGPSGCGKTTLLRIIAGLEQANEGEVLLDNQDISGTPVHNRDFGLMFQDFALFPHMNVARNVMFGLRMRGMSAPNQEKRLREVLELVGLTDFADRDVSQLSGGERQRVALARSLAPNPRLLMLDEPLGSLDAGLRDRLVVELRTIIKRMGLTAIYVTHDQHEAFAIADRIAIMNSGRVEQVGMPETLYRRPKTVFAAQFLGLTNIVSVTHHTNGIAHTAIGDFPTDEHPEAILIHPDGIELDKKRGFHTLTGQVIECVFQGGSYLLRVEIMAGMVFMVTVASINGDAPQTGDTIRLAFDDTAVIPLWG
jgi:ABC-type Fe3+/spermidine/putrescine transport system ATPase subunit